MNLDRWQQKVALVTGASSGIGQAVARTLATAGMQVVAVARRYKRLEALRRDVEDSGSPGAIKALQVDLLDEDQILAMFRTTRDRFGGVDLLVNAAGCGHFAPLSSGRTDHWREMLMINVLALSICTREAIADMRRRQAAGQIIHISSMAGYRVPTDGGVYAATKAAVRALTEASRQELRAIDSPIRVAAISPGFVETEFAENFHKRKDAVVDFYAKYKVLQPQDIADAVTFILSTPEHVQVHDILLRPLHQPA